MQKITIENTALAKACDEVVKKWRFKDREAMLKYAVAIMLEAETNMIMYEKRNALSDFGLYDTIECRPSINLIQI